MPPPTHTHFSHNPPSLFFFFLRWLGGPWTKWRRPLPAFTECCRRRRRRRWCSPWRLCRWSLRTEPCSVSSGWRRRAGRLAVVASSRWCGPNPWLPRSWWSCAEARSLWWLLRCRKVEEKEKKRNSAMGVVEEWGVETELPNSDLWDLLWLVFQLPLPSHLRDQVWSSSRILGSPDPAGGLPMKAGKKVWWKITRTRVRSPRNTEDPTADTKSGCSLVRCNFSLSRRSDHWSSFHTSHGF